MFIIRLLFYSLEGLMGSSFLNAINLGLGLFCVIHSFKICVQFGLPNRPARFILLLVSLCLSMFFVMRALVDIHLIDPVLYLKWRPFPMTAGVLGLLVQVISFLGRYGHIQQKVLSRIPVIGALFVFYFFQNHVEEFFVGCFFIGVSFFILSKKNALYQKRMLVKMMFFFILSVLFDYFDLYWLNILGRLFLFPALFYFFIFEQSLGISALVQDHQAHLEVRS
jgi:hypothetical protein